MIAEAIRHYHDLLTGPLAADARERLAEGTARHRLTFGARPLCTVLRPLFVTEAQYDYIRGESRLVLAAIAKLGRALMADAGLRAEMDLSPDEERIVLIEPGYEGPDASGRLDAFLDSRGGFSFVEYNAESPGGLLYGDALGEIFMG
ncbi:MAG TPA: hypothetical protein VFC61_08845, partial [Blastocatellia bacterium]|nr:hypothetical protein [Blastocatellia bacterium]